VLGSLVEVLRARAERHPEREACAFLEDGETVSERLTYGELDARARALAALLQERGFTGQRALLLYPSGLDFVVSFLGCLYAGVVAVPCYPPRPQRAQPRLAGIAGSAQPELVLTTTALLDRSSAVKEQVPALSRADWLATNGPPAASPGDWRGPGPAPSSLAFLQYTSGSTSQPKGVMVSHANLVHNEEMIRRAFGLEEEGTVVGWLPLYHDMGLIGNLLQPLYAGGRSVLMPPLAFLQRPRRWLEAVSRFRAVISGGPDFAYALCASKLSPEQREGLDLAAWRVAYSGAEPVRAHTLERFAAAFAGQGFAPEAFYPCYGLAEATLFVAGGARGSRPLVRPFRRDALEQDRAEPAGDGEPAAPLVGCGEAWLEQRLAVVDPATCRRCLEGQVGEIWVAGASIAEGYWGLPEETRHAFQAFLEDGGEGPFLRTGDLGFLAGGELFVAGRLKDLIILRGRNHYPQDFELTAERSHAALRTGCSAAFSVDVAGEERLVIVAELERRREAEAAAAAEAVRRAVAEEHEAQVHDVVLVRMGSVPKTSSGKIQRHACRAGYLDGSLEVVERSRLSVEEGGGEEPSELDPGLLASLGPADRRAAVEPWLLAEAARALGVPSSQIDPARPLTSLGLDSLGAAGIKGQVEASLGVPMSLGALLEGASLADLTTDIAERLAGLSEPPVPPVGPAPSKGETGELPLSYGQRGLWYLHRLAPESLAYHLAGAGRVHGSVDVGALARALTALAVRHPSLCTTFGETAQGPVQRVHAELVPELVVLDLEAGADLEGRLQTEIWRRFDLERGPLLRLGLLRPAVGEPVLFLAIHHIVCDFGSAAVIARDLGAFYALETGHPGPALAPLDRRFGDHVRWQVAWAASAQGERQWAYWREVLIPGGCEPPWLELPADRPRPALQTWSGDARGFRWAAGQVAKLKELARRRGATLYMLLLAGFEAVLARYTGQRDLLIGSPTTGRFPALADLVGYFVNPVALRVVLPKEPSFTGVLDAVKRAVVGAFEHQDFPFTLLAERVQPQRDPSRSPLFDVLFTFQPARGAGAELGGFALGEAGTRLSLGDLAIESLALRPAGAPYSLDFMAAEVAEGLGVLLRFNCDLFDGATIERLAGHYRTLLAGALAAPEAQLSELPLLTAEESRQLLVEWARKGAAPAEDVLLHEFFAAQVRRTPEATALIAGDERLSYRELDARADRMARRLRALRVGPEVRVGIFLHRTARLLESLLGVLKAGGAYVPLDPAYPRERLEAILGDAEAPVVVTEGALLAALPAGLGARIVRVDEDGPVDAPEPSPELLPLSADRCGLAYVIYTSGSTGRPKGVAIEHRSAAALMRWSRATFSRQELSGVLASTSICFDLSVFELFAPLAWGGTVVLAENAVTLAELPARGEVTLIDTVPSAMAELLRQGAVPRSVRTVSLAGEPLRGVLARQVHAVGTVERLLNLYGPSEDTTFSSLAEVGPEGEPTIGCVVSGSWGRVLDADLRLLPVGVPGELCLGGAGLSRGYLGRPDLTAERFVPDPFSTAAGERLYRTGDLVRWRGDGELEHLGRLDRQVKLRGFRIELGEIESALLASPALQDAAVLALGEGVERRLVAFVVWQGGQGRDLGALRGYLKAKLPEYMMPSAVVTLEALPLTPNGKVDRRALARMEPEQTAEAAEFVAPRTPVEARLATVWAEVLGLKQVGIADDFFALGGHSLLAIQLVSRLREAFGVELPLRRLFTVSTVEALARELEDLRVGSAPPLRPVPRVGDLPLSFAQERMWFLHRLEPESPQYNIPGALRLRGRLDVAALHAALGEIVRRHESLRTTFALVDGRPVQRVSPAVDLAVPLVETVESELRRLAAEEARRPFDLVVGPVLRAKLLRVGEEDHALLVTMHHIVADGWSIGVLLRELSAHYLALAERRSVGLPDLAVQYADFAVWQRQWLAGDELEARLAWWKRSLDGAPTLLELPADRTRPAYPTYRGALQKERMPAPVSEALKDFAQSRGATPFMVLLALLGALCRRYTGQQDILLGSPVAGRDRVETEELIGFFGNTLVMRVDLTGDPGFGELVGRVREMALGAMSHRDLPFEKLVEELSPERDASRTPLFQVLLALQNAPFELPALPELHAEVLESYAGVSRFDLTLFVRETPAGFEETVEYALDLFDAATVERLLGHLRVLVAAALADPGCPVSALPLLTTEESEQLRVEWTRPGPAWPEEARLHQLFEAQVRRTPEAIALIAGEERLSYRELDLRAERMTRRLRALGVGPEVRVGIFLHRTSRLLIAMLGTLKAGGAYVPLDPAYPRERLEAILGDAEAPVVVTEGALLDLLPVGLDAHIVRADETGPAVLPELAPSPVDRRGLAYVIYTSGSTGRPKGIAIEHRSVEALMHWSREAFCAEELAGVLASTSICFDMSVFELFAPLSWGGTVILADSALAFAVLPARDGVTLVDTVPAAMAELLRQGAVPPSVRTVNLGGEPLRGALARQVHALGTVERLLNLYGPSEDTTFTSIAEVGAEGEPAIGRILPNSWGYVVDRDLRLVPAGVPGELYLAGAGLSRGYLGRPDLTAERYLPDPFSTRGGERLYKTGDLVRWRRDGELEYLGRLDHQVKIRGFRVELGEIEATLLVHPALEDAAVLALGEGGERRLVAFVVVRQGQQGVDLAALRGYLKERLPEYMLPSGLVVLEALPLTPNGKIDRRALAGIEPGRAARADGYMAPRTPTESRLAEIWAEVLGLEKVGVQDDFFDLGGHSLLATQIVSRVRESFGVELPLRLFFEVSTIEGQAGEIAAAAGPATATPQAPIDRGRDLPLSFAQERLWFLESFEPGTSNYNLSAALRLCGPLEAAALEAAMDAVVARHEPLRTIFAAVDGVPVQRVAAPSRTFLPVADLSGLPPAVRECETGLQARLDAETGFQLDRRPPIRAALLRLGEKEHVLLVTLHHIVADGWSMGVLVREIAALYGAAVRGEPTPLSPLPLQFADHAIQERAALTGEALAGELDYWRQRLAGAPPALELPTDRPRPAVQMFRGARESLVLPPETAERLRALSSRAGATLFMTLLAAFEVLLARQAGQEDLVVGTPIAGRRRAELEGLIGMFLNSLALRTDLSGDPRFLELLARVRAAALDAYSHQDLPFERLLAEVQPERSLSRTPIFQVFFNLLSFPFSEPALPGLSVELLAAPEMPSKFDLTVYAAERGAGLRFDLVYNAVLFDRERIRELLGQYREVLARAVAAPEERIGSFSLLTPEAAVLLPDPAAELDASWRGAVHERFAGWARSAPQRLAVSGVGVEWSYSELNARANRLAHCLLTSGVGRGDLVALYGHRSAPLVWAVLGVLKAGAAFTVLDPSYPGARLVETLRIARPRAWVAVEAAGAPPGAVAEHLEGAELRCRLTLGVATELPAGLPADDPAIAVGPDDFACVPFTSGSTGAPKGILGRHGPLSHFVPWQCETFGLGPADRFSLLSGLAHDPLQRDLFTPLQIGAAVYVPDPDRMGLPGWLAGWMAREGITVAHLTPALGQLLADSAAVTPDVRIPSLRWALLVGDVLARRDVARLRRLAPAVTCINLYGSTETQRAVGYHVATAEEASGEGGGREVLPLGRGMRDVQLLVLDAGGGLAGIGELGEICVRSPHLAGGYLADPELTRERFRTNPFTGRERDRIYRTGDLGRYLPNGEVVFVSRADLQVKIRGFRVELGEIEAVLGRHPAVREAVVAAREDDPDGLRLAAYVVPVGEAPAASELQRFLAERLPAYMVPADFVTLRELPLTPNRKVDRRSLPAPERTERAEAPTTATPVEEVVAALWAEALGRERVGADDDFFGLGGHSLLAMRIAARLHGAFGVELPLRALFESPTVAGLARAIEVARRAPELQTPAIARQPRDGALPLSFSQQRLWFLDRLGAGSSFYNLPAVVRFLGELGIPALARSLAEVVRRHEPLRTAFAETERGPVQLVLPPPPAGVAVVDLSALPAIRRESELRRLAAAEAERPFDLGRGYLFRFLLLRLGERDHAFLYTLHHIVSDGWSMEVLVRETAALYSGLAAGALPHLPELPVQQADFAAWQRRWLQGEVRERLLAYWRRRLAGAPPLLALPTDRRRSPIQSFRGAVLPWSPAANLRGEVATLSRRGGATQFMTLLAAFQVALHLASGQEDLVVGTDIAGRGRCETEGLIGFFVNQLPLRARLAGNPSFLTVLAQVREAVLGAYDHQDLPFDELVDGLNPERSLAYSPIFQVKLNLRVGEGLPPPLPGLVVEPLAISRGTAQLDLILNLRDSGSALHGWFEYASDLFDATTIERLGRQLKLVLGSAASRPEVTLDEIRRLAAANEDRLQEELERELETAAFANFQSRARLARTR
jgi:amino acid adenylation domain-containing protein